MRRILLAVLLASVALSDRAQTFTTVKILPRVARAELAQQVQFGVRAMTVGAAPTLVFSVTGTNCGTVDPASGLYTAPTGCPTGVLPTGCTVVATYGAASDAAVVTVSDSSGNSGVGSVAISPKTLTVQILATGQFSASVISKCGVVLH